MNRNRNNVIRLTESELRNMIKESVKRILWEDLDVDYRDVEDYYVADNGDKKYGDWLRQHAKMPKGYDKDLESCYGYDIAALNEPNPPISPAWKKAEEKASWDKLEQDYDDFLERSRDDAADANDANYNIYNDWGKY